MITRIGAEIATLGVGKSPIAPGTMGSLLGFVLAFLLMPNLSLILNWGIIIGAALIGWWAADCYQTYHKKIDAPEVVIDELSGLWLCYGLIELTPIMMIAGLILFRFFDIIKPWPIGWIDKRLKNPFGTMLDDWLAGLASAGTLLLIEFLWL